MGLLFDHQERGLNFEYHWCVDLKGFLESPLHSTLHKDLRTKFNSSSKIDTNTLVDTKDLQDIQHQWTSLIIPNILRLYTMIPNYFHQSGTYYKRQIWWQAKVILSTFSKIIPYRRDKICKKMHIQIVLASKGLWALVYGSYFVLKEANTKAKLRQYCLDVVIQQLGE